MYRVVCAILFIFGVEIEVGSGMICLSFRDHTFP